MGLFNAAALQRMFQEMSPQNLLDEVLRNGFGILEKNIFANVGGIGNMIGNVIPGGNTGFGGVFSNFIGKWYTTDNQKNFIGSCWYLSEQIHW